MERILILADNLVSTCPTSEALQVAESMQQSGREVRIVELGIAPSCQGDSIEVESIHFPNRLCASALGDLRKICQQFVPAQIHCWGSKAMFAGALANLGLNAALYAVHSSSHELVHEYQGWRQRFLWSRFDRHFLRHGFLLETVQSRYPRWNIGILPWSGHSRPQPLSRSELGELLNIPSDAKLAGTSMPLVQAGRLKDFIWAGDLMKCIRDDVYWLVIGEGIQSWRLKRFARHLEIGENLRFLNWHPQAGRIVDSLDVYVEPSFCFDGCRGLVRAISGNVPVVTTSHEMHRQLASHGFNGYAVERGARNEIARCVNRLINSPDIAERFSDNASLIQRKQFRTANDLATRMVGIEDTPILRCA